MRLVGRLALCMLATSCVSYSSIQKTDKDIYLSGAVNYVVISVPFLKRCEADGQVLHCEELKEFEPPSQRRSSDGTAETKAPAPTSDAGAAAPPEKKPPK